MQKIKKFLILIAITLLIVVATLFTSSAKGDRDWKWPVPTSNSISSCYLDGRSHYALDIPAGQGASIYASYPGTVIATYTGCSHNYGKQSSCGCGGGLGNYVYIKHTYQGTNYVSRYGHMTAVKVSVGASVTKNTIIGTVGTTGYSTGNHLDFRIYKGSSTSHTASTSAIDPFKEMFLEMPSGFRSTATTSCCSVYVNEVKALYSTPTDTQKPIISNVKITNVDFYGYTVTCTVSDNKGVTRVSFPTWSNYNGQDDIRWKDGTISGNTATFRVNKTDHNNENGTYTTDIYVYDAAGNYGVVYGYTAFVDAVADLETTYNGTKYILYKASVCYADAEKYCRSKGGYLAKITTAAENAAVAQLTKKYGSWCWINGSDNAQEGVWKFSSGEKIAYTNWGSGEPNSYMGTDQDYIAMHPSGEWDDSAGLGYGFICEFEHDHSYTSSITTQPTCTKEGVRTYKCSCGASYTEKIAKKAHSYTSSVTTQPTCTKEGVRTYKCSCGASYTETIAKKAHTIVTDKAVSATCTKTGLTEGKKCSTCGTVTVAQKTVAALGHKDANGDYKCDNGCGYEFEKPAEPCSCNCHKGGIAGFFFKIILFFQKFFRTNKVCACGVAHY